MTDTDEREKAAEEYAAKKWDEVLAEFNEDEPEWNEVDEARAACVIDHLSGQALGEKRERKRVLNECLKHARECLGAGWLIQFIEKELQATGDTKEAKDE